MFETKKNKKEFIILRVTEEEKEFFSNVAAAKGMDMSNFLRYCISKEINKESEEAK